MEGLVAVPELRVLGDQAYIDPDQTPEDCCWERRDEQPHNSFRETHVGEYIGGLSYFNFKLQGLVVEVKVLCY